MHYYILAILGRFPYLAMSPERSHAPHCWSLYVLCSGTLNLSDVPHLYLCWDELPSEEWSVGSSTGQALCTLSSALGCQFYRFCVWETPHNMASLAPWCQHCPWKLKSSTSALTASHSSQIPSQLAQKVHHWGMFFCVYFHLIGRWIKHWLIGQAGW